MTALALPEPTLLVPGEDELEGVRRYAQASRAVNTYRAYDQAWRRFLGWCDERRLTSDLRRPGDDDAAARLERVIALRVGQHLADLADQGMSVSTIALALAGLGEAYRLRGFGPIRRRAEVREVMKGIRRSKKAAPSGAAALTVTQLRAVCRALPEDHTGVRDRCLLLLGFGGAMRRSELVGLDVEDIHECDEGLRVVVRRSKTDQDGRGVEVPIPFGSDPATCPVRATRDWVERLDRGHGPLFVSVRRRRPRRLAGRDVGRILKRRARAAGIDSDLLSAHSLRSGLATEAARAGHTDRAIMSQGRWASRTMVDRYVRTGALFDECAASGIGL